MNKNIKFVIIGLVIFGVGFFAGMEYKAYQVRTAFEDAFSGKSSDKDTTMIEEAKKENSKVIQKAVGEEISLATIKVKVNNVEEKQSISSSYGSPKVAKEGTKFVVLDLDVTNIINNGFSFSTNGIVIIDNKDREFETYNDTIGSIDNYLDVRELSPSVKENGFLVYEIPEDATKYSLVIAKDGTNELYKIVLK